MKDRYCWGCASETNKIDETEELICEDCLRSHSYLNHSHRLIFDKDIGSENLFWLAVLLLILSASDGEIVVQELKVINTFTQLYGIDEETVSKAAKNIVGNYEMSDPGNMNKAIQEVYEEKINISEFMSGFIDENLKKLNRRFQLIINVDMNIAESEQAFLDYQGNKLTVNQKLFNGHNELIFQKA